MYRNTFIKLFFVFFLCGISRATALYHKREAPTDKEQDEPEIILFSGNIGVRDKDSWFRGKDVPIAAMHSHSLKKNTFFALQGASADQVKDIEAGLNGDNETSPWTSNGAECEVGGVPIIYDSSDWGFINGPESLFRCQGPYIKPITPKTRVTLSAGLFIHKTGGSGINIVNAHFDCKSEEELQSATKFLVEKINPWRSANGYPIIVTSNLDYSTIGGSYEILANMRTDGSIETGGSISNDGSINSGGNIGPGGSIDGTTGGSISTDGSINSGGNIGPGGSIDGTTGGSISTDGSINSGGNIGPGGSIDGSTGGSISTDGSINSGGNIGPEGGGISTDGSIGTGNIVFADGDGIAVSGYESMDTTSHDNILSSEYKPSIVTLKRYKSKKSTN
ncbi:uncharacterized protein J8A68_001191 [[Candida] subhashii]|uniref:Uncharacterized protein n=1 Tax=[Candida] subhashii TaxID=561895 RepID=A0A8J5UZZ0_9ASCO|nr:uncharacterized protein J8A68_001191 [[Candida] subhashii]KAG7665135.1 hypothetical protein J8A68_001191 [[Candida] subhashii]